jgi:hypothetical protein
MTKISNGLLTRFSLMITVNDPTNKLYIRRKLCSAFLIRISNPSWVKMHPYMCDQNPLILLLHLIKCASFQSSIKRLKPITIALQRVAHSPLLSEIYLAPFVLQLYVWYSNLVSNKPGTMKKESDQSDHPVLRKSP